MAPPQYSPDGNWFWTGSAWVPAPPPAPPTLGVGNTQVTAPQATAADRQTSPGPQLLAAGASRLRTLPPLALLAVGVVLALLAVGLFKLVAGGGSSGPSSAQGAGGSPLVAQGAGGSPLVAQGAGGSPLVAQGKYLAGTRTASGGCQLDGTLLTATGDDGAIVGSQTLSGTEKAGVCEYAFSFPVKATTTLTFHAGPYSVIGPDGHDGQVAASALAQPLLLYTI